MEKVVVVFSVIFLAPLIISTHLRASELFMPTLSAPYRFLANIHQSGSTVRTTAVAPRIVFRENSPAKEKAFVPCKAGYHDPTLHE
jgi:hypothetical protein